MDKDNKKKNKTKGKLHYKESLISLLCVVIHVYGYKAINHMENRNDLKSNHKK